jgi:uncharacterized protein YcgI (DUF1989 family)
MIHIIEATESKAFSLYKNQYVRIIDREGGQVADLTAFRLNDSSEWLSNGRSFDYGGTIYFTTGSTLFSNMSNPMLTIVEDNVGRHDFLFTACSREMYRIQYNIHGYHPNCLDNLRKALAEEGQEPVEIPTPFNIFMNVEVREDGRITVLPPLSKPGDGIVFRAEMAVLVALSACPSYTCNKGTRKSIGYEITSKAYG